MRKIKEHSVVETGAIITNQSFDKLDLENAYLRGSQLTGSTFRNSNLSGADLRGCDLSHCDFTGATLDGADLTFAIVEGTIFDQCSFIGTVLFDLRKIQQTAVFEPLNSEQLGGYTYHYVDVPTHDWMMLMGETQSDYDNELYEAYLEDIRDSTCPHRSVRDHLPPEWPEEIATAFSNSRLNSDALFGAVDLVRRTPIDGALFQQFLTLYLDLIGRGSSFFIETPTSAISPTYYSDYGDLHDKYSYMTFKNASFGWGFDFAYKRFEDFEVSDVSFPDADFSDAALYKGRLQNLDFERADFSRATFAKFPNSEMLVSNCNFRGASFARSVFGSRSESNRITFLDCNFENADFSNAWFYSCRFSGNCNLDYTDFTGARTPRRVVASVDYDNDILFDYPSGYLKANIKGAKGIDSKPKLIKFV
jgi:uncharacterized protein YjbI with pentapeptide repeats